jgi:hypothetical protein
MAIITGVRARADAIPPAVRSLNDPDGAGMVQVIGPLKTLSRGVASAGVVAQPRLPITFAGKIRTQG